MNLDNFSFVTMQVFLNQKPMNFLGLQYIINKNYLIDKNVFNIGEIEKQVVVNKNKETPFLTRAKRFIINNN